MEVLIETLSKDAAFLRDHLCLDYSLLIGVHDPKLVDEAKLDPGSPDHKQAHALTFEHANSPKRGRSRARSSMDIKSGMFIPAQNVVTGEAEGEIYFVALIDFLSRYFVKKKIANFFKTKLWDEDTLSTVPPVYVLLE